MMRPSCSRTTKSLSFSQISASVRGSRVPSFEYEEISSWMCLASGKIALRVRMQIDLLSQRFDFLSCGRDLLPHSGRRRATAYVVNRQHGCRFQAVIKVRIEDRIEGLQFIEPKILKFTIPFQAQLYRLADLLVRQP